ncbi:LysR family transcriptional regulator [Kosakonia sp. R1.Fl]|uniref:LysR family transcriptional regulator n=1 Tax=Kosakonia sp. R1.Fl TaxID=2928706 RepID=UPI00201DBA41|nr:LysR family transcriptional regulator [Kosakonia sp. R1.Fl]MCL6743844.1 LysR family transcriptional regulator [Kosakonia sp. R1.Fl]
MINLNRLDLNLLLTLDVLLREHNVTRAAQRLNLSQPSVSVQLARLREIFDDPLLLPGPRGMQPTVRADELREPLRQALEALERAVSPVNAFDPARASVTWRIAATDYTESVVLLPLLGTLRRDAPASRLAVFELNPGQIKRQAEQGDIDLFFHLREGAPASLHQRLLFTERYVLAGRVGHPALKRRPSLKQFCKLEHVIVSPEGGGFQAATDDALAARGLTRNVVLSVPHFLFMLDALARTDLVAVLPERLVATTGALQVVDPPLDLPGFDMLMLWHERLHRDPGHKWLRQQVLAALANADSINPR